MSESRFASADIPTLRRALLEDAEAHYERHRRFYRADEEPLVGDQSGNPYLAAWSALAVASSQAQMIAGLLGIAQRDPGLTDAGRTEMTRLVGQVLDGWPEVLDGANDDLPDGPEPRIPGQGALPIDEQARIVLPNADFDDLATALEQPAQPVPELVDLFGRPRVVPAAQEARTDRQEIPAAPVESLLESARREWTDGPHPAPGEDAPTHPGPGESCQDPACVKSRAQHEAAADIQQLTAELFDGAYETDADPQPETGDHGTCAAPVGRGAEGAGTCGYGIVLREERTALMADGTDGHGQPGGQRVLVWRHEDPAIDGHHRAQLGGPA